MCENGAGRAPRQAVIRAWIDAGCRRRERAGRTHARAVIPEVLALVADGRLKPETVTTTVAPLDDAPRALTEHVRGDATKTILTA